MPQKFRGGCPIGKSPKKITISANPGVVKFLDMPQMHLMDFHQARVPIWHLEEVAAAATLAAILCRDGQILTNEHVRNVPIFLDMQVLQG